MGYLFPYCVDIFTNKAKNMKGEMTVKIHQWLPDGFTLAKSCFDFVDMDIYGSGYKVKPIRFIVASPSGEFHEFSLSEYQEYHLIEKYVKNEQLWIGNQV